VLPLETQELAQSSSESGDLDTTLQFGRHLVKIARPLQISMPTALKSQFRSRVGLPKLSDAIYLESEPHLELSSQRHGLGTTPAVPVNDGYLFFLGRSQDAIAIRIEWRKSQRRVFLPSRFANNVKSGGVPVAQEPRKLHFRPLRHSINKTATSADSYSHPDSDLFFNFRRLNRKD